MAFPSLFESLKLHFKARGMTYAEVALALGVSEATVKRIFSTRDCSMARFSELCDLVQVDVAELARTGPRESRLLTELNWQQEEELVADEKLFLTAVCALNQMSLDDVVGTFRIERSECIALLLRLERLGILELHPGDRIRVGVARTFAWIPNGPIMRHVASLAADYFDYPFAAQGELMRIINVRVSKSAGTALMAKMEQLAREYSEQHAADSVLPLEQRPVLSICLAARHWEPALFKHWLRPGGD